MIAPELWAFFLVVFVGIVAGSCIEVVDTVQTIGDAVLTFRYR